MSTSCVSPKSALVIGGGPSGLITLRNLSKYCPSLEQSSIGGVWFLQNDDNKWQSPAYPDLVGNVLPEYLSFSSYPPFPPTEKKEQPFPTIDQTFAYLTSFAKDMELDGKIRCGVEVLQAEELKEGGWKVALQTSNDEHITELWDAVICCTGIHSTSWWPSTGGLDELRTLGRAKHASEWMGLQSAQALEGKKVLVLGNAASGNDIAAQLASVAPSPGFVYRSIRRPAFPGFPSLPDPNIQDVSPVRRYSSSPDSPTFTAELEDGTLIEDLDLVFAGTGYRANPSYPLMDPSPEPWRIPSLHQHILYTPNPSLAFIGCIMCFTPFTISDLSSIWLALAWSGKITYPDLPIWEQDRLENVKKLKEEWGGEDASNFASYNVLGYGEQTYAEGLRKEVESADAEIAKTLPLWNDEETKRREAMYDARLESLKWLSNKSAA
ncbi:hypothetical protein DL96DRAFT_1670406 [Flagelloscypha sp. PMI_526]|nr:hypothetical protein DL96DRAFT_1670406 [Flagelloscypha sp. PMI_526]